MRPARPSACTREWQPYPPPAPKLDPRAHQVELLVAYSVRNFMFAPTLSLLDANPPTIVFNQFQKGLGSVFLIRSWLSVDIW